MRVVSFDITAGTAGTYAGTVTLDRPYLLEAVEWLVGTMGTATGGTLAANATASTADVTLLTITTGSVDAWYRPRSVLHDYTGSALSSYVQTIVPQGALTLTLADTGTVATTGKANVYLFDARWM
jgi:hypothetical protein